MRLARFALAAISAASVALGACGDDESAVAPAPPESARTADGYHPTISPPPLSGEPVEVRYRVEDGDVFHLKGEYRFRQTARGKFDPGTHRKPKLPPAARSFEGTLDLARRVSLGSGALLSRVEGTIKVARSEGDGAPSVGVHSIGVLYAENGHGSAVHKSIRTEVGLAPSAPASPSPAADARGIASDDLEALWHALTAHFGPPERPVRVGERFAMKEGLAIDGLLLRPTWTLFQRAGSQVAQPTGAVWAHAVEEVPGVGLTLLVRAALHHEQSGPTDPPPVPKDTVEVGYEAAIEAFRRLALDGGWAVSDDVLIRRRYRFRSPAFDYYVENERMLRLTATKESR